VNINVTDPNSIVIHRERPVSQQEQAINKEAGVRAIERAVGAAEHFRMLQARFGPRPRGAVKEQAVPRRVAHAPAVPTFVRRSRSTALRP